MGSGLMDNEWARRALDPTLLVTDRLFGEPDEGVTPPPVQESQALPVISSTDEDSAKRNIIRRSGRRKTLITRDNQLGAGDVKKKTLLG